MDLNKVIFYGSWTIILLLIASNVKMSGLKHDFDTYCIKKYDLTQPCPCNAVLGAYNGQISGLNQNYQDFNASSMQKLLYIQNLSAS